MRRLWLPLLVIFLSFCGLARAQTIQVAVIGDSNVAGTAVSSSETYPAQLERALRARGHDVRVLNSGRNGDTTDWVMSRLSSAAPEGTKVAVLWVGVNDRRHGRTPQYIQSNRAAIVAQLRQRGIETYVIGPAVYNMQMHDNDAWIVADGHFNGAGYAMMVGKTIGPISALVAKAKRR